MTGSDDGRCLIYKCPEVIEQLLKLTADNEGTIAKDALLAIVNLSAEEEGAKTILEKVRSLIQNRTKHKTVILFCFVTGSKLNHRMHQIYFG